MDTVAAVTPATNPQEQQMKEALIQIREIALKFNCWKFPSTHERNQIAKIFDLADRAVPSLDPSVQLGADI